ncbi:MAG: hypothetical protein O2971_17650 [Proteobacteria bacterium]|nr:hypothetical protein [Pseudomonadota bacterium]
MNCYNHPHAPTAAHCKRCDVEMCGMCTQFLKDGEYCEKCAVAIQSEAFVTSQSRKLNKPEFDRTRVTTSQPREEFHPPTRGKDKDKIFIWLGVGGSSAMIFFSMLLYSFPLLFENSQAAATRQAAQALEDCRLVFEEIGYLLERGELPDNSLRCAGTNTPNIVSQNGEIIRVSHPNPAVFGLGEIYVTNDTHEVIFVEREQG